MGLALGCCRSPEEVVSSQIHEQNKRDYYESRKEIHLLMLGAGESGKSTLFKQLRLLYAKTFSDEERVAFVPRVHANAAHAMRVLVEAAPGLGLDWPHELLEAKNVVVGLEIGLEDESENTPSQRLSQEGADAIRALWASPVSKEVLARRVEFHIADSAEYFLDSVERMVGEGYLPSDEDIVRCRTRTTGVTKLSMTLEKVLFVLYDVGGQRNERRKWIHCFDNCTAILFVTSLSEYDEQLAEDRDVNRMEESLGVFEYVCNAPELENIPVILFLNKKDLLEEKLKTSPLNSRFPEYDGGSDPEAAMVYIQQQFQNRCKHNTPIYNHFTCATDGDSVRRVFDAVKDIVLTQLVEEL